MSTKHAHQHKESFGDQVVKAFHQKASLRNLLAVVVFGAIILSFILTGVMGGRGAKTLGVGVAATVDGEIISLKQYQEQQNRVTAYYSQMLGSQFEQLFQKKQLFMETMNQLVNNSVAVQSAEKEKIYASDSNVRNAILDMPYFKKDGHFQSDVYKGMLAANGLTATEFEKNLRQDIILQKTRELFEASAVSTDLEKNLEQGLKNAKINLNYIQLNLSQFNTVQNFSDAAVTAELAQPEFKKTVEDYTKTHLKETEKLTPEQAQITIGRKILAERKMLETTKKLEAEVANIKTLADFSNFAAQNKLSVKETGLFSIAQELAPGMNSSTVLKEALNLTTSNPVDPKIIHDGDNKFIIALKHAQMDPVNDSSQDQKSFEFLARQKSYTQYQKWVNDNKKKYSIVINDHMMPLE